MLTQAQLKEILNYNSDTGVFTWKINPRNQNNIGDVAGSKNKSNTYGYIHIQINNKAYMAHRLVWLYMYGEFPTGQIDHINGARDDNRIENLREATFTQNQGNKRAPQKNNTSGYLGVTWHKGLCKYVAKIKANKKTKHLGTFSDPAKAHQAYLKAKRELHEYCTI